MHQQEVRLKAASLVGGAAVEHGLTLMTRDRRAADTYRRLDVKFVLVD